MSSLSALGTVEEYKKETFILTVIDIQKEDIKNASDLMMSNIFFDKITKINKRNYIGNRYSEQKLENLFIEKDLIMEKIRHKNTMLESIYFSDTVKFEYQMEIFDLEEELEDLNTEILELNRRTYIN